MPMSRRRLKCSLLVAAILHLLRLIKPTHITLHRVAQDHQREIRWRYGILAHIINPEAVQEVFFNNRIMVPSTHIGQIIGLNGRTIKEIQQQSGAKCVCEIAL